MLKYFKEKSRGGHIDFDWEGVITKWCVSSNIEAVRPLFFGRRGAARGRIIKNSGRRSIIYASHYYARGGASLYMQVIKGAAQVRRSVEEE